MKGLNILGVKASGYRLVVGKGRGLYDLVKSQTKRVKDRKKHLLDNSAKGIISNDPVLQHLKSASRNSLTKEDEGFGILRKTTTPSTSRVSQFD